MTTGRTALTALVLAGWAGSVPILAREGTGTPAARARFADGEAAAKAGKLDEAIAAFRKAIDADPAYVDAHQRYIETTERKEDPGSRTPAVPRLRQQYEAWARRYPTRAVYQWALGFLSPEANAADAYFKKALAIDPKFARAHFYLARNADERGDFPAQLAHLKAAVDASPDEPRYLMRYAYVQRRNDPERFKAMALDVIARFPASQQAAEALYRLAEASPAPERRRYLDRLHAEYPIGRYGYSSSSMYDLYGEAATPSEALVIAREMVKANPSNTFWSQRVALQEVMARTQALIAEGKFAEAADALDRTKRPSGRHAVTWTLLKADAAAGAGHVDQAYASLVDALATIPDDRMEGALAKYGSTLGRSRADVDADVWRARDANAKTAAPFELASSRGGAPVRLADYRGRLVLLAFWFPG